MRAAEDRNLTAKGGGGAAGGSVRCDKPERMEPNQLLVALLQATEHWENDPRHARWDGTFISFVNARGLKPPLLGAAAESTIREALVDDLADRGLVRMFPQQPQAGIARKFALTEEGRRQARAAGRTVATSDAVDLSWPILAARLRAFVEQYERAGAPERGLPLSEDDSSAAHLRHLLATGYLERTEFSYDQQDFLRPTERAFSITRAWPSAEAAAAAALDDLVTALGKRDDPASRSAREHLTTGGRDLFVEVVAAAIAKQAGVG
jgi:hypothetical protein